MSPGGLQRACCCLSEPDVPGEWTLPTIGKVWNFYAAGVGSGEYQAARLFNDLNDLNNPLAYTDMEVTEMLSADYLKWAVIDVNDYPRVLTLNTTSKTYKEVRWNGSEWDAGSVIVSGVESVDDSECAISTSKGKSAVCLNCKLTGAETYDSQFRIYERSEDTWTLAYTFDWRSFDPEMYSEGQNDCGCSNLFGWSTHEGVHFAALVIIPTANYHPWPTNVHLVHLFKPEGGVWTCNTSLLASGSTVTLRVNYAQPNHERDARVLLITIKDQYIEEGWGWNYNKVWLLKLDLDAGFEWETTSHQWTGHESRVEFGCCVDPESKTPYVFHMPVVAYSINYRVKIYYESAGVLVQSSWSDITFTDADYVSFIPGGGFDAQGKLHVALNEHGAMRAPDTSTWNYVAAVSDDMYCAYFLV